jgi:hypothetical protein
LEGEPRKIGVLTVEGRRYVAVDLDAVIRKAHYWTFDNPNYTRDEFMVFALRAYSDPQNWDTHEELAERPRGDEHVFEVDEHWQLRKLDTLGRELHDGL